MHMVDVSANHDDRIFAEPERFDIFRSDLYSGKILRSGHEKDGKYSHMAFGVGPHLCPGAWISHQEAVLGSRVLAEALPNVRINHDRMPKDRVGAERTETDALAPVGLGAIRKLWLDFDAPHSTER